MARPHSRREQDKAPNETQEHSNHTWIEKNIVNIWDYDEGYEFNITVKDVW
jgi:hypothetical protein